MDYSSRLRVLLGRGYFPKELPRAFTTSDFGVHAEMILQEWETSGVFSKAKPKSKVGGKKKANSYNYTISECSIETISAPKRGYERRDIHITHPIPQALLAHEITKNWAKLLKYLPQDSRSIDRLEISEKEPRGLSDIDFELHRRKKAYIESQSDWIVKTDITRYYPSIYTHSIAWACYGKEPVKKDRRFYEGSIADRLDQLVRASNRNQTIGIPIGPETSRIISELIGRHVDGEVCSISPQLNPTSIDRLQDDWFVGTSDRETAQLALSTISKAYRSFGLEINGNKTSLTEVGLLVEDEELSEIRAFLSSRYQNLNGYRLQEFLSLVERLHMKNPRSSAINYALSVLEGHKFDREDVELVESFLLKSAKISQNSMSRICNLILNLNFKSKHISHKRIGNRVKELADRYAELGCTYELIWLLWVLRGLNIKLSSKIISNYTEENNLPSLSLILLDMRNRGLFITKLPESKWVEGLNDTVCRGDSRWLLAYEGFRHGWLADTKGLMAKPFFAPMASRNVAFYDPRANVIQSSKNIRKRFIKAKRTNRAFTTFLLRSGFLSSEY